MADAPDLTLFHSEDLESRVAAIEADLSSYIKVYASGTIPNNGSVTIKYNSGITIICLYATSSVGKYVGILSGYYGSDGGRANVSPLVDKNGFTVTLGAADGNVTLTNIGAGAATYRLIKLL